MSTTLSQPKLTVSASANLRGGAAPAPDVATIYHSASTAPAVGTSAGQADKVYAAGFTIANSGTALVLDLMSLTDPLGGAINFAYVSSILLTNDSTTAGQDMTLDGLGQTQIAQAKGGWVSIAAPNPGFSAVEQSLTVSVDAGTNVSGKITIMGRTPDFPAIITLASPQAGTTLDGGMDALVLNWTTDTDYAYGEIIEDPGGSEVSHGSFNGARTFDPVGDDFNSGSYTLCIRINGVDSNHVNFVVV